MFYQIKKDEFSILCQPQKGGVVVTVSKEKETNTLCFGVVNPGNLYLMSENKWILIDSKTLVAGRKFNDYMDRAVAGLVVGITRMPVNDGYLKLEPTEGSFLEWVCYNLSLNKPLDIPPSQIYYIGNGKLVTVTNNKNTGEYLIGNKVVTPITPQPFTPQIIVSPAKAPTYLQSPKLRANATPSFGPMAVQTTMIHKGVKNDKFYAMVEARGRKKIENPNWADEMYPNYKEDMESCERGQIEMDQKLKHDEEKKNMENEEKYKRLIENRKIVVPAVARTYSDIWSVPVQSVPSTVSDKGKEEEEAEEEEDIDYQEMNIGHANTYETLMTYEPDMVEETVTPSVNETIIDSFMTYEPDMVEETVTPSVNETIVNDTIIGSFMIDRMIEEDITESLFTQMEQNDNIQDGTKEYTNVIDNIMDNSMDIADTPQLVGNTFDNADTIQLNNIDEMETAVLDDCEPEMSYEETVPQSMNLSIKHPLNELPLKFLSDLHLSDLPLKQSDNFTLDLSFV